MWRRDILPKPGGGGRFHGAQGGDLVKDDIVRVRPDLVLFGTAFGQLSACLAKLHAALKPGGELICVHAELPCTTEAPPDAVLLPAAAGRPSGRLRPVSCVRHCWRRRFEV